MFTTIYFSIGLLTSLYVFGSHCWAIIKYFRQLYTSYHVSPTEIKTYFNMDLWMFWDEDPWYEVVLVSSLLAVCLTILSNFIWPAAILFYVHVSVTKARERIEKDR